VESGRPPDIMAHAHYLLDTEDYKPTHSEYVILIVFYINNGPTNAPQCYVIHILPILLVL